MLKYFIVIWNIDAHLQYFMAISVIYVVVVWYIFLRLGILYQEKSGNPG
jgi:hypothetical protein